MSKTRIHRSMVSLAFVGMCVGSANGSQITDDETRTEILFLCRYTFEDPKVNFNVYSADRANLKRAEEENERILASRYSKDDALNMMVKGAVEGRSRYSAQKDLEKRRAFIPVCRDMFDDLLK